MKAIFRNHILVLVILLLLSAPLTIQLFQPGFFVGDDGEWMIIRSSAFHEAFRDGQFPVRFLGRLNNEYGYPVPTFLYPGYLYLTEPIIIAGFGFIDSIKIMFTLTMILSGVFAYLWLSKLFSKWSALLGALVYLYTPYHLVDMYKRGSLGELLALAVVPFILWQIERRSIFFSAIGIALLILSHNIMAMLFLPVIFLYAFLRMPSSFRATEGNGEISHPSLLKKFSGMRSLHSLRSVGMTMLLGIGLATFFWLPAVYELQYTVFSQTKIAEWDKYFATFSWIGTLQIALLVIALGALLFSFYTKKTKKLSEQSLVIFFILLGLLSIFFSSKISAPLWNFLPVTFIQFPFRFLSLEIVAAAFVAAFLLDGMKQWIPKVIYAAAVIFSLTYNAVPFFTQMLSFDKGEGFYVTNQSTTTTRDEYTPVWVKEKTFNRPEKTVEILKGDSEINNLVVSNKTISFSVKTKNDAVVQVNKVYWPGWTFLVDGNEVLPDYINAKGVMTVKVSAGNHSIKATFNETPVRLFADILSVVFLIALVSYVVFTNNKNATKATSKKRK